MSISSDHGWRSEEITFNKTTTRDTRIPLFPLNILHIPQYRYFSALVILPSQYYRNIKLLHTLSLLLLPPALLHMYQSPFSSPCSSSSFSLLPCITHPPFLLCHCWSRQGLERKRSQITWLETSFYSPSLPKSVRASKRSHYPGMIVTYHRYNTWVQSKTPGDKPPRLARVSPERGVLVQYIQHLESQAVQCPKYKSIWSNVPLVRDLFNANAARLWRIFHSCYYDKWWMYDHANSAFDRPQLLPQGIQHICFPSRQCWRLLVVHLVW